MLPDPDEEAAGEFAAAFGDVAEVVGCGMGL